MASLSKSYLILYNVIQTLGWTYMLYLSLPHLQSGLMGKDKDGSLYKTTGHALKLFQTAAILEIVHAALGLVKSSPVLTGFQVMSRVFVTWAIVHKFPEAQVSPGYALLFFAWVLTEMIRYPFYTFNLINVNVSLVTWLRYTLFIFLYPMGVTGELWCQFVSLGRISKEKTFGVEMPNPWNFTFNFYYTLICIMILYIPIFPQLYFHMVAQRRKIIGKSDNLKSN